ncbi:MAG: Na/Pi symporter, partial [Planctomycetota bacterium]
MSFIDTVFGAIGGLGLFLYGMGILSDGLKMVAGNSLRTMMERITKWPALAMLIGAGATVLIQSSSATTVIVVGLINAGLLSLKQSISVVLGANVGTTCTAWIVGAIAGFEHLKITTYT